MPKTIFLKTRAKNLSFNHVCEVGVYWPETSNILDFILENTQTTLVEADPLCIKKINEYFKDRQNIQLFPVAVYDYNGQLEMVQRNASTFVGQLSESPAIINDAYKVADVDKYTVETVQFSQIDKGDIDLLSVDVEGCEWYVLKYMQSRPKVISLETHGKYYINPFLKDILSWMQTNSYEVWYKDVSDTVFIKKGLFELTLMDKLKLKTMEMYLSWRRNKKIWRKLSSKSKAV